MVSVTRYKSCGFNDAIYTRLAIIYLQENLRDAFGKKERKREEEEEERRGERTKIKEN